MDDNYGNWQGLLNGTCVQKHVYVLVNDVTLRVH